MKTLQFRGDKFSALRTALVTNCPLILIHCAMTCRNDAGRRTPGVAGRGEGVRRRAGGQVRSGGVPESSGEFNCDASHRSEGRSFCSPPTVVALARECNARSVPIGARFGFRFGRLSIARVARCRRYATLYSVLSGYLHREEPLKRKLTTEERLAARSGAGRFREHESAQSPGKSYRAGGRDFPAAVTAVFARNGKRDSA